jgi:4-hydroxy-2-oxoheptanedioate aldolase
MLGPGDFSVLSGVPFAFDSKEVVGAADRIAKAAAANGIDWGMPSSGPEHSRQLIDKGARFITHGSDVLMVKRGLEAIRQDYRPLGFTFDDRISGLLSPPQE